MEKKGEKVQRNECRVTPSVRWGSTSIREEGANTVEPEERTTPLILYHTEVSNLFVNPELWRTLAFTTEYLELEREEGSIKGRYP
jgi:hypothetical protein